MQLDTTSMSDEQIAAEYDRLETFADLSVWSDVHKDALGFRPRYIPDWKDHSDYKAEMERLGDMLAEVEAERAEFEAEALEALHARIIEVMKVCNCSSKDAMRFLLDGEDNMYDDVHPLTHRHSFDYVMYHWGIGYNDRQDLWQEYGNAT